MGATTQHLYVHGSAMGAADVHEARNGHTVVDTVPAGPPGASLCPYLLETHSHVRYKHNLSNS